MESPQTKIRNKKNPIELRNWVRINNVPNILVEEFEKAGAISNFGVNRVAYLNEKNNQLKSKPYSVPGLKSFCTKINKSFDLALVLGGGK